jgi:predicted nucleic acid-binding protein
VTPLFVDTSGWANFFDRNPPHNELAHTLLREAQMTGSVVTTSYVLSELASLLISPLRFHHSLRQEISDAIRTAKWIDIVRVSPDLDSRSWQCMARYRDKTFSWSIAPASS